MNLAKNLAKYRYEYVAVVDGAVIMTLELVGARIIAPYFGSTIFVWTAVIGVILGALSAGYWYGGRIADRGASDRQLAFIMSLGALVLMVSLLLAPFALGVASQAAGDLRWQALLAALLLFAPFNLLAGIVSPYLVKLRVTSLQSAGSSVGRLYAAGTVGSILGTFLTGYWLIGWLGSRTLAFALVIGLLASTFILNWRTTWWQRLLLALAAAGAMAWPQLAVALPDGQRVVYDGDSAYLRYMVSEAYSGSRPVRLLATDNFGAQSGIYLDDPSEPLFDYIKRFMEVAAEIKPRRVLVIGGGAYTLPRMLAGADPRVRVDVVEIDSKLDGLAKEYFAYKDNSRVKIIHADGRTFLNGNRDKYDLVYMDAFSSLTPPFTLTTTEAVRELDRSLAPGGVIAVNLVSPVTGPGAGFLRAELATYRQALPAVALTPARAEMGDKSMQNLMMVAGRDETAVGRAQAAMKGSPLDLAKVTGGLILTDDFAPVEQLLNQG